MYMLLPTCLLPSSDAPILKAHCTQLHRSAEFTFLDRSAKIAKICDELYRSAHGKIGMVQAGYHYTCPSLSGLIYWVSSSV